MRSLGSDGTQACCAFDGGGPSCVAGVAAYVEPAPPRTTGLHVGSHENTGCGGSPFSAEGASAAAPRAGREGGGPIGCSRALSFLSSSDNCCLRVSSGESAGTGRGGGAADVSAAKASRTARSCGSKEEVRGLSFISSLMRESIAAPSLSAASAAAASTAATPRSYLQLPPLKPLSAKVPPSSWLVAP